MNFPPYSRMRMWYPRLDECGYQQPQFEGAPGARPPIDPTAGLDIEAQQVEHLLIVTDSRDPQDDQFLQLALRGKASHRASDDRELLLLYPFRGIRDGTAQESAGQC
jgi:hypothetical protein